MPTRTIHPHAAIVLVVAAFACAPATSPVDTAHSSETTADDTSTAEVTSSAATMSSGMASAPNATSDASGEPGTSDTGTLDAMYGRYVLTLRDITIVPDGCGVDSGPARNWSLDLLEPADDGSFSARETYGGLVNVFACAPADGGFACIYEVNVDYAAMGGPDATVHLVSRYEAMWDGCREVTIDLREIDAPLHDVTGIYIGRGEPGPYECLLDDVRLDPPTDPPPPS